ncbi:MAG: putative ABC transport system permease protein [Rhodothermales bacterium]|jgi:putative ABC transport system permease protein
MIRNFFRVAFRNMLRHKGYAALNILGLAVGLACAFVIVIWIQDEVNTDRFHEDSDRIYSVMRHSTFGGTRGTTASMPKPLAQAMREDYPEVEHSVLLSWDSWMLLGHENERMRINGRWAGPDFFELFSFPLAIGDAETALDAPESIVLTAKTAQRFFGRDWRTRADILGQRIRVDNRVDLTVTGVAENPPPTSTIDFAFIIPIEEYVRRNDWVEAWDNNGLSIWAKLHPGASVTAFNAKFKEVIDQHQNSYDTEAFLYPITRAYLYGDFENGVQVGGRIEYVRAFSLVAFLIILIASINFMNLATARSAQRAREIGVRKTAGATRASLAAQFMGESLLKAIIAFFIALGLMALLLPSFNTLTQKGVTLGSMGPTLWLLFAAVALLTGVLAGTYPAIYLSGFSVTSVFRLRTTASGRGSALRKALVVAQFSMSIILIVGTLTVYRQLEYIRSKDLGLDKENVAMVRLEGGILDQFEAFKRELAAVDGVLGITTSNNNPLQIGNDTIGVQWEGKDPDDNTLFWNSAVGYGFVETMGIELSQGREFSEAFGADSSNYLVNWRAADAMGLDDPVGKEIAFWEVPGTIVGVMEDFHMGSMYRPIRPVILRLRPQDTNILIVRTEAGRTQEALAGLETLYGQFNPEYVLNVRFMDQEYEESYRSEVVLGTLANAFAVVALFIACLGLFGLASFTAEQRSKEIGIRKVLGASVPSVANLLSREFLLLVAVAFLIAAPISYVVMEDWLGNFAYRVDLGVGVLGLAFALTLIIAWATVSYQSIRCALLDPVHSLRAE